MQKNLLGAKTITQAYSMIKAGQITAPELCEATIESMKANEHLNAYLTRASEESMYEAAEKAQVRLDNDQELSILDGIPIAVKDNILVKGMRSSASSLILKDFKAPIDSTAVKKLREAGAVITGQTNMDEMGMGSFGLQGYNGVPTRNPIDPDYCAGGSSAGSASVTKSYQCMAALGTDTGGSVNYPAHCCGLVSLKPSFGRVSRFGQILYSSSNETTGPMAHSVADIHSIFDAIQGPCEHDSNSVDFTKIGKIRDMSRITDTSLIRPGMLNGLRVGVLDEFNISEMDPRNQKVQRQFIEMLKDRGAIIKRVSVPFMRYVLPFYFTLIPAEAATNLSRFDGLKYGAQPDFREGENLEEYVERVRSEGFGLNVKRRVMLGNYLLSNKANDKILQAQKIRRLFIMEWCQMMEKNAIDVIISPTAIRDMPPLVNPPVTSNKTSIKNPVYEFKSDYFTAFPNTLGIPSMTLPVQENWRIEDGERVPVQKFPTSVKLCTYFGEDYHLLRIAKQMETMLEENGLAYDPKED